MHKTTTRQGDLFLGIDGGQSSTRALVVRGDFSIAGIGTGGPSNHLDEPGGIQRLRRSLRKALFSALPCANARFRAAFLGMTGRHPRLSLTAQSVVRADRLNVANDAEVALFCTAFGRPAIAVISGTGSVCIGCNSEGMTAFAGGWGYLMGDEGSAYWVGMEAIRAACRAHDGRSGKTLLSSAIPASLGTADLGGVRRLLYSGEADRPRIAGLARIVADMADRGDRVARRILRDAGRELAEAALATLRRLKMGSRRTAVGCSGGLFRCGRWIIEPMGARIARSAPQAFLTPLRLTPVVGAVCLAFQLSGISPTMAQMTALESAYREKLSNERL